jgi:drug/metabolite transporter (DMT)-like permease
MSNQTRATERLSATGASRRSVVTGMLLVLASAFAWSTMGFFVRMVPVEIWIVIFWRSIFGGLSIIALAVFERRRLAFEWRQLVSPAGIVIVALVVTGMLAAIYSMQNTTIANVTVIYATLPFMSAVLAWLWFREHPGRRPLLCSLVAGAGVTITVGGTIASGGGHLSGDFAAVYMTFTMALFTVILRRYRGTPMLESVSLGCLALAVICLFVSDPFTISAGEVGWLAAFGIVTIGGGAGLYTSGARLLPSAQAALLSASEVPMSPLWVWMFFDEVPARETFIGGALVLGAILWNIMAELRTPGRSAPG